MKRILFYTLVFSIAVTKTFGQKMDVQGTWNGTVTMTEDFTQNIADNTSSVSHNSHRVIKDTIKENAVRGSHDYIHDLIINGKKWRDECHGNGSGKLYVLNIRSWNHTYDIGIDNPECHGENSGTGGRATGISDKNYGNNPNVLQGTDTTIIDLGPTAGKTVIITTWDLKRAFDVELIVTLIGYDKKKVQKSYDDWLPEPGKDEYSKGSVMNVLLKLQSKSGKPLKYSARSFELKLSNTSAEPGITINFPLNPSVSPLPDLRFIAAPIAESPAQDQSITLPCNNGVTGKAYIASYDGGGFSTLTVTAKLEGDITIDGHLSNGEKEIPIPKRDPGSNIAKSWLAANGYPGETDDKETSLANKNDGDGLSVYEEYRGVISEENFKRLDPNIKELGVRIKKAERSFFLNGFDLFNRASNLEIVRFFENEIPVDRRLNKNSNTAHVYDQYALKIEKGDLPIKDAGKTYCNTDPVPNIPKENRLILISPNNIALDYQFWQGIAKVIFNRSLPYSLEEKTAYTIAHELGHGVSCKHHGDDNSVEASIVKKRISAAGPYMILSYDGTEIKDHSITLDGLAGNFKDNLESGDLSCLMANQPYNLWVATVDNNVPCLRLVPLLPLGFAFCNSREDPQGINKKKANGDSDYFGDAANGCGDCQGQIKLK